MSLSDGFRKCLLCECRKLKKSSVPEKVATVEINCSNNHNFCVNCIQLYSRIDEKCPLCATDYSTLIACNVNKSDGDIEKRRVHEPQITEEEKKEYINYLHTISDLSSEEEVDDSENAAQNAERCIRNRIKQMKRLMRCNGVDCVSKQCMIAEHDEECSESIEEFHVGEYDWKEAENVVANSAIKSLKREKTFEELLNECEQFVEKAIEDEEQ